MKKYVKPIFNKTYFISERSIADDTTIPEIEYLNPNYYNAEEFMRLCDCTKQPDCTPSCPTNC